MTNKDVFKLAVLICVIGLQEGCSTENSHPIPAPSDRTSWDAISSTFVAKSDGFEIEEALAVWDIGRDDDESIISRFGIEMRGEQQIWQFRLMNFELGDEYDRALSDANTHGFHVRPSEDSELADPEALFVSRDGYIRFERQGMKIRGSGLMELNGEKEGRAFEFEGPFQFKCTDNLAVDEDGLLDSPRNTETLTDNQFCRQLNSEMEVSFD